MDLQRNIKITGRLVGELYILESQAKAMRHFLADLLLEELEGEGRCSCRANEARMQLAELESRSADVTLMLRRLKLQRKILKSDQREEKGIACLV